MRIKWSSLAAAEELVVNLDSLAREKLVLHDGDIVEICQPEDKDVSSRWTKLIGFSWGAVQLYRFQIHSTENGGCCCRPKTYHKTCRRRVCCEISRDLLTNIAIQPTCSTCLARSLSLPPSLPPRRPTEHHP